MPTCDLKTTSALVLLSDFKRETAISVFYAHNQLEKYSCNQPTCCDNIPCSLSKLAPNVKLRDTGIKDVVGIKEMHIFITDLKPSLDLAAVSTLSLTASVLSFNILHIRHVSRCVTNLVSNLEEM